MIDKVSKFSDQMYLLFTVGRSCQRSFFDKITQLLGSVPLSMFCAGDCHVSEIALMALDLLAGGVVFQVLSKKRLT